MGGMLQGSNTGGNVDADEEEEEWEDEEDDEHSDSDQPPRQLTALARQSAAALRTGFSEQHCYGLAPTALAWPAVMPGSPHCRAWPSS